MLDRSLRNQYASGLHPPALRKDIRRLIREEKSTSSFKEVKTEAQRWMREDSLDAATTDQLLTTPSNEAITRLEVRSPALLQKPPPFGRHSTSSMTDQGNRSNSTPDSISDSGSHHNLGVTAVQPSPAERSASGVDDGDMKRLSATTRNGTSSAPGSTRQRG